MTEAQDILAQDEIFKQLVVQRSRAYARESQIRERGSAAIFPDRKSPQVADYSIRKTYGRLLDIFENAFQKTRPLFTLAMYYPLAWYKGADDTIDPFEENCQRQVVGLIRTQFLKRFESSVAAFELSCERLLKKLLAFLEVHSESDSGETAARALEDLRMGLYRIWYGLGDAASGLMVVKSSLPAMRKSTVRMVAKRV